MPRALVLYAAVACAGLLRSTASAYSWQFTSAPQQCQNLTLSLTGSGQAPYSVFIVPFGPTPLPDNIEVRKAFSTQFNGTSVSIPFDYPADSQFVVVVSDSSGFGSGGTSGVSTVQSSSDSSCFDPTTEISPDFTFSISPSNIAECSPTRIWWTESEAQGTPSFQGIIPGGQSFDIPASNLSTLPAQGYGFSWTPSIRVGTSIIVTGGDNRGPGTAGSADYNVAQGPNQDCLTSNSPSSTPGSPAGGSYPTGTIIVGTGDGGGSTGSTSSGGHSNVGAIAGGVAGGVCGLFAVLALIGMYSWRRRRAHAKGRPVDLLQSPSDENGGERLPLYCEPEPYILPVSSTTGIPSDRPMSERRSSADFLDAAHRSGTPSAASTGRTGKSAALPSLRPVNIVQHEDAGPPPEDEQEDEPEMVELPPAYANLKGSRVSRADEDEPSGPSLSQGKTARA